MCYACGGMRKRILLVEDNDDTRQFMALLLRQEGHEVWDQTSAEDAEAAIERGLDCQAHVAILDVRLPGEYGDEFGRRLKKNCPRMRVIFVTAETDIKRLKRAVESCF